MNFSPKKALVALSIPLFMAACTTQGDGMKTITASDLQHHNWELAQIDGKDIVVNENFKRPSLEIGEKMTANGHAGCNNYFGQGELKEGQFRIQRMGATMKMCPDNEMKLEQAMSATLSDWADISMTKDTLTLQSEVHTLTFTLRDWVN